MWQGPPVWEDEWHGGAAPNRMGCEDPGTGYLRVALCLKTRSPRWLAAFSGAVFAVIVTIMVLELKAPDRAAFSALWPLAHGRQLCRELPVHRHHLGEPLIAAAIRGPLTLRLISINFIHLFMVSLLPFATAWVARTQLASFLWRFTRGGLYRST
jgi:hypothetical protein